MGTSILAILAALVVPLGLWLAWLFRKKTSPKAEIERQKHENEKAIADGTAGQLLDDRLSGVPPSKGRDPGP